jgi:predicted dehydrogenase
MLKELIVSEKYGKAYRAEFVRYSELPTWSWNNWILDPEKSGGCVFDMHIHDVDLINWFFGAPKTLRSAVTEKKAGLEAIFTQYFYDGLFVTSAADWSLPSSFPFEARCQINFERACAVISGGELTVYRDGETEKPKLSSESSFLSEMREFLAQVIDGAECSVISAESVRDSVKLAKAEILSAKLGEALDPEAVKPE